MTRAVESYEALTGETVDVDKNAIAEALKKFAAEEMKTVLPIEAQAKAHQLPVLGTIQDFREALSVIEAGSPDDCVNTLAGGGTSLKQAHDRIRKIAECLDDKGLAALRQARQAVGQMWPQLEARGEVGLKEEVEKLKGLLAAEDFYESLSAIGAAAKSRLDRLPHALRKGPCRPWRAVPRRHREDQGANGMECGAGIDAAAGAATAGLSLLHRA